MALDVETGTFDADSSGTPSQTQNVSVGFDPKALIIWGNLLATTNADTRASQSFSRGFVDDANNNVCNSFQNEDSPARSDSRRTANGAEALRFMSPTSNVIVKTATITLGTGQFTLTWVINDTNGSKMHWIAFGGADITGTRCSSFIKSTTTPNVVQSVNVTDSDVKNITAGEGVLFMMSIHNTLQDLLNDGIQPFGMATKITEMGTHTISQDDNTAANEPFQATADNKILQSYAIGTTTLNYEGEFDGFDADGFDIDWTTNNAAADFVYYLIIKGGKWQVGNDTHRITTTGTKTTTTDFQPKAVIIQQAGRTANGIANEDFSYNFGAAASITSETSSSVSSDDNADPMRQGIMSSITRIARVLNGADESVLSEAELNANFSASEFVLNYTTVDANAYKFTWCVCGDEAGGQAFTANLSDTVAVSDSLARQMTYNRAPTPNAAVTVSDAVTRDMTYNRAPTPNPAVTVSDTVVRVSGLSRSLADTVTVNDTLSRTIQYVRNLSDTVTVSDTLARMVAYIRALNEPSGGADEFYLLENGTDQYLLENGTDFYILETSGGGGSIPITDNLARAVGFVRPLTETVTVSDTLARVIQYMRNLTDTITVSDVVTGIKSGGNFVRNLADTVTVSDTVTRVQSHVRTLVDTITISDTVARVIQYMRNLANTVTVSDVVTRSQGHIRTLADTVTISDTLARVIQYIRTLTDTVTVSDVVTAVKSGAKVRFLTDTVTVSDALARVIAYKRALSDTVTVSDTVTRLQGFVRTLADTVTVSDTVTRVVQYIRALTETVTVSDSLARVIQYKRALANTVVVSDVVARVFIVNRSLADTVSVSDTVTRIVQYMRSLSETVTVSDTIARTVQYIRALSETVTISDVLARLHFHPRALVESVTVSDTLARIVAYKRSLSETVTVSDTVTGVISAVIRRIVKVTAELNLTTVRAAINKIKVRASINKTKVRSSTDE